MIHIHPSYNPHTGAVRESVADLIRESVQESRIVHLAHSDGLAAELARECEGVADWWDVVEFWGVDCDGAKWRIRLYR